MKLAYFDCFSGISGDMTIAAFLYAGFNFETLKKGLSRLKVKGYSLRKSKVARGGLSGTRFECVAMDAGGHSHRSIREIFSIIDRSSLNIKIKKTAKAIFTNIGIAEAKAHGIGAERARLHELGDIDSIVDIVGAAIAVYELGIDAIYASNVRLGRTVITSRHGAIPIPAPAALELLKDVPVEITELPHELVTPTGAGILKTLSKGFGRMPRMKVSSVGYGAGSMEIKEQPNMLRVLIGTAEAEFSEDTVTVIETNIDDMSPQAFEYLFERLFRHGALDVYITNIVMKKTRPAFKLTVLSEPGNVKRLSSVIFSETTAIGLRYYEAGRFKLEREIESVRTRFGDIKVKVSGVKGKILNISPEYDDCVRIARQKDVTLKTIYDEAIKAKGAKK